MNRWIIVAALGLAVAGCKQDKDLAGVGKWNVNKTKLSDATGRCLPEKLADGRDGSYCFAQPQFGIKGMTSEVDLFFAGTEPTSPLVKIQLKVRGCKDEQLFSWMQTNFGDPYEKVSPTVMRWKNAHLYAVGRIPFDTGLCILDFLPISEKAMADLIK